MRSLPYILVAAAAALLAWQLRAWVEPEPRPPAPPDTVEAEADAPDDTEGDTPDTQIIYRTRTDTVNACLSLPQDLPTANLSLVQPRPVGIDGRSVTLTRYEMETQRYVQDVFKVPRPDWAAAVHAYADASTYTQRLAVGVDVRYKMLTITPSIGLTQTTTARLAPAIRVRMDLGRWAW